MKDIKNLFNQEKEIKWIKDIVFRNIKNLFGYEKEEENYYKPVEYIEKKSNGDKNTILYVEEYPDKIRPYLKSIINHLKKSGMWKIQLTITINFFLKMIMMKSA